MRDRRSDRLERGRRGFGRSVLVLLCVLALVAVGLVTLGAVQGPRLASVSVDAAVTVERAEQRIVLQSNQPLVEVTPDQVRVEPAVPVTLLTQGAAVGVQFTEPLDYGTEYRIAIDVEGQATGARGTLEASFTTPDTPLCLLDRGTPESIDGISCAGLIGGGAEVLLQSGRLQEYAAGHNVVVAVNLDAAGVPTLVASGSALNTDPSVPGDTFRVRTTPTADSLRDLRLADGSPVVGYLALQRQPGGAAPISTLYLDKLTNPEAAPVEVVGPGGQPLSVLAWAFVPGTTTVVVQAQDLQMFVIDALGESDPVPLGQHTELRGFLPGGVDLIVADAERGSVIDLRTGATTILDLPDPVLTNAEHSGKIQVIAHDRYLAQYYVVDPVRGTTSTVLLVVDHDGTRQLLAPPAARIHNFCASPNGRYAAVELAPDTSVPDRYPVVPGSVGGVVQVVRIADGAVVAERPGMLPDWCRH